MQSLLSGITRVLVIMAGLALLSTCANPQDTTSDTDMDAAPNPNGVFRYDVLDLTNYEKSVSGSRSIVYGRYRAYFGGRSVGHGPAGLFERRGLKEFRNMHTVPESVGKPIDMTMEYEEKWEGPNKLVISHIGKGPREADRIRRTYTRICAEPSEWDGAWEVEIADETTDETLPGRRVLVRYGDYIGLFCKVDEEPLYAVYALQKYPHKYYIIFSTKREEVGSRALNLPPSLGMYIDHSVEYQGTWDESRWVETYVETSDSDGRKDHRMRVTYAPMQ